MLPPDLDPDNYDDWTDESNMECLRFNFKNNPNVFFNIFSASGNGKLDFERHWNQKKIVLKELSVRKRMRYNVGIATPKYVLSTYCRSLRPFHT